MATILLVDDEPKIVFLTRMILEKKGHRILVAEDGEECMRVLENERPDLILLDVMLPGDDGWEICRKIKENNDIKDIPVVMFTVCGEEDSVEKSLEYARADAHITKPFEMKELLNVVNGFLKG